MSKRDRFLIVSDTQEPFGARSAVSFCKSVQKEFKIPSGNIYHVGDEVDQYFASLYPKDPDVEESPTGELKKAIDRMKQWYAAFPLMKLANSNHGNRWKKKAFHAQIPSIMMKRYQDVIEAPPGWVWRDRWMVKADSPFEVFHGIGFEGQMGFRNAPLVNGISCVFGHSVTAGIAYINTGGISRWGMCVGALIDVSAYAFHYSKDSKFKPSLGVGVVIDGGKTPLWIPLERFR